jgi:hypothetical protein
MSYEDSVLDHADQAGNLSTADATHLLREHGCTLGDLYEDSHGLNDARLRELNAEALLAWLGY